MEQFIDENFWLLLLTLLWTLPWKGVALWKAGQKKHLAWFIAILVLNTFAGLEILYIFIFSKMGKEGKPWYKKIFDRK
jgi:hypothetical protein